MPTKRSLNPFGIRASVEQLVIDWLKEFGCLNPFGIRASVEHRAGLDALIGDMSQSLWHQGIGGTSLPTALLRIAWSQSLWHQGIGGTMKMSITNASLSLNPFGIRASVEPDRVADPQAVQGLNPFGIRASVEQFEGMTLVRGVVSIPLASGHRWNSGKGRFQFNNSVSIPLASGHRWNLVIADKIGGICLNPFGIRASVEQ